MPSKPSFSSFIRCLVGRNRLVFRVKSGFDAPWVGKQKEARVPDGTRILSCDDLKKFTNGFSDNNFLGKTDSTRSRVYRGELWEIEDEESSRSRDVIVEIWEIKDDRALDIWQAQINLLTDPIMSSHPNVAKVYGCCKDDGLLGVVYDCQVLGTLRSMILDDQFTWCLRIKVALRVARLLSFLHAQTPPLIVLNVGPGGILLDMDFNPLVFGFGLASGGILGERPPEVAHPLVLSTPSRYTDPMCAVTGYLHPLCDVYSFGALLLTLITKSHDTVKYTITECIEDYIPSDAVAEDFSPDKFSLHHFALSLIKRNFLASEGFHSQDGSDIAQLAVECAEVDSENPRLRPGMFEAVNRLKRLLLVQEIGL